MHKAQRGQKLSVVRKILTTPSYHLISVDLDPWRENPPHLLQTPEPISSWYRHTSITPDSCKLLSQLATSAIA